MRDRYTIELRLMPNNSLHTSSRRHAFLVAHLGQQDICSYVKRCVTARILSAGKAPTVTGLGETWVSGTAGLVTE